MAGEVTNFETLVLVKIEPTKGTDSVPTPAANAVRVVSVDVTEEINPIERSVVKATTGKLAHLQGKAMMTATITCDVRGSGAAGTAPDFGPLMMACGLDETISASVSVAYDPLTLTSIVLLDSVSMYIYKDGQRYNFIGSVGDMTATYEMDAVTTLTFTMSAPFLQSTDVAYPGGETYQTTPPIVASNADVVSEGGAIKVGSFTFNAGNTVAEHYTTGQHEFVVADRDPNFSVSKDSISTNVDVVALAAGTPVALSAVVDGGAGNKFTLSAGVGVKKTVAGGVADERFLRDIEYGLYESTGDDAFQWLFE